MGEGCGRMGDGSGVMGEEEGENGVSRRWVEGSGDDLLNDAAVSSGTLRME
jgi:hypothetical protein